VSVITTFSLSDSLHAMRPLARSTVPDHQQEVGAQGTDHGFRILTVRRDEDHGVLYGRELRRGVESRAARAANDEVTREAGELTLHFSSPEYVPELPLEQESRSYRDEVEGHAHTHQDQRRREDAGAVRVDGDLFAVAHGRERDRRHEERPDDAGARVDHPEADRPHDGHTENEPHRPEESPPELDQAPLPLLLRRLVDVHSRSIVVG
jgi:hypothetical protein